MASSDRTVELLAHDNRIETAWLAGILEGEGCFSVDNSLRVAVEMKDLDVIRRVSLLLPGTDMIGSRNRSNHPGRANHSITYVARCAGENARTVMEAVRPYMGERRKRKIDECLAARPRKVKT